MATDQYPRIAKFLGRAGVASRREAERIIAAGRVSLNGQPVSSPATLVSPEDLIELDGAPIPPVAPARLWRYHKPPGLVTTARDPQGRPTVFGALPKSLPRVISVGRLDLNTEGLLILTNDGELARYLEHPAQAFVRTYRVRVHGVIEAGALGRLRTGITAGGIRYRPAEVEIDRDESANRWLTISLHEGKNREVKRLLGHFGLQVTRLIRIRYGPFELGDLPRGAVAEIASPANSLVESFRLQKR